MTRPLAMIPGDLQEDVYYLPLQHVRPDFLFGVKLLRKQCASLTQLQSLQGKAMMGVVLPCRGWICSPQDQPLLGDLISFPFFLICIPCGRVQTTAALFWTL